MILITAATGPNGIEIVKLLSSSRVPCRALTRNPHKAGMLADLQGVEIVHGDLARPESFCRCAVAPRALKRVVPRFPGGQPRFTNREEKIDDPDRTARRTVLENSMGRRIADHRH